MRQFFLSSLILLVGLTLRGADPTATDYPAVDCQGSLKPYVVPEQVTAVPDSLTPVYISHVGRHGSRYPASATHCNTLMKALEKADADGTITPLGKKLKKLTAFAIATATGRWGALDSLGMAEQRGIASRMIKTFPQPFKEGRVNAISSYSPRSMMSMYSFTHQLDRLDNKVEFTTSTGHKNSDLMRPFDTNADYRAFIDAGEWKIPYEEYFTQVGPGTPIERVVGKGFDYGESNAREMSLVEYYVIAGMSAMSVQVNALEYFTKEEYNALWSVFNLRQYLQRSSSTLSTVPAEIATPLLLDIVAKIDGAVNGDYKTTVDLRFGHAETLFPLFSLLRLSGCYYLTNYFDTVRQHWKDFTFVPMSANIQFIILKSRKGRHYLRVDLNERPISLIPNDSRQYLPWSEARNYMMRCIPLYAQ